MGEVFDAVHTWTNRRVALKLHVPEDSEGLGEIRRFMKEARVAAGITHPNIVEVLDMGVDDDGTLFLALELLQGQTLGQRLEKQAALAPMEIGLILLPVMRALSVAHAAGVIHRDLKPENIFLHQPPGQALIPKLLDFGLARNVAEAWGSQTQTGALVGTPLYMAPEQVEHAKSVGPQADVWSTGVLWYQCLTGRVPFSSRNFASLIQELRFGGDIQFGTGAPGLPSSLVEAVEGALRRNTAERYADMVTFIGRLEAVL